MATAVCGVIGGVINVGVGLCSLKESIQAFRNGDKLLGIRLALDAFCLTGIGLIMILVSLGSYIGPLHGISMALTSNTWVLPVIFFVITIPLIIEITIRVKKIVGHKDMASKFQFKEISNECQKEIIEWGLIKDRLKWFIKGTETKAELAAKMEELQAEMGVSCALNFFKLFEAVHQEDKEAALRVLPKIEKKVKEWNSAQWVRLAQQALYIVAFVVSMGALCPKVPAPVLNGGCSFGLAAANAIPLYMDSFWPFKRNTPIVVPKVDTSQKSA